MTQKTDDELLELIKKKNTEAFRTLFSTYEKAVYNYILKYSGNKQLAQELLQETFTRVWFSAHLYRSSGKAKSWLYTIARNTTRSEMAKKRYAYRYEEISELQSNEDELSVSTSEGPDIHMEQQDLRGKIAKAMKKLKPEWREIITLKNFQQLKFREIAEITKIAEGTLKARYLKAVSELRTLLGGLEL